MKIFKFTHIKVVNAQILVLICEKTRKNTGVFVDISKN